MNKICIGNDIEFEHSTVNLDIGTIIIHGDCSPQSHLTLINHIDIESDITRSSISTNTIKNDKVLNKLSNFSIGEMAERFKAHAWKACILLKVSWVRIPLSPPLI